MFACDRLLEVVAALLVVIEEHVDLVDAAEEVVDVAHDVLVRAGQEDAEVVRRALPIAWSGSVSRESSVRSMNLRDLAVRVARDVDQRALDVGPLVEAVNRHDREERAERPVIEQRLEDREVADVLVGELLVEARADRPGTSVGIELRRSRSRMRSAICQKSASTLAFTSSSRRPSSNIFCASSFDLEEIVPATR